MPDEYRYVAAFADSCPEECLSPHLADRHRWHTLSVVMGNLERQADILAGMQRRCPKFQFMKWEKGRSLKRNAAGYRSIVRRLLVQVLAENRSTATVWSFRESTIYFCLPMLLRDFRISPLHYVLYLDRKGRARVSFPDCEGYPREIKKAPLAERFNDHARLTPRVACVRHPHQSPSWPMWDRLGCDVG